MAKTRTSVETPIKGGVPPTSKPTTTLPTPPNPPKRVAGLTTAAAIDATLKFFATASNETLGACAVGLCASTYLVLGRVGLVLIGAVGGIVLHATWDSQHGAGPDAESRDVARRKKELGVEVAHRALDWRDRRRAQDGAADTEREDEARGKDLNYDDLQPETRLALTNLTDAVIRDYVKWWYSPLLPKEQSFPLSCRQTLTRFIVSLSNHLSRKRIADPVLDFMSNSTSIIIVFLDELSTALKASQNHDAETAITTYLHFQPDSNLANVLSAEQQARKLNLVADDILQNFLDPRAYSFPPVKAFLREVLAGLVLETTIDTCAKPEWINGWIVYLLEAGEPELMNVIDAGVEDMSDTMAKAATGADASRGHTRRISKAEEAMQEAMREAQRLNEMIAEDEARRRRGLPHGDHEKTSSIATADVGMATPTSSDSGRPRPNDQSLDSSLVFDIDGNAVQSATPSPSKELPAFTHFDQLPPTELTPPHPVSSAPAPVEVMVAVPLTLHQASITMLDMGDANERAALRQKPVGDYLVQIEPASQRYPGWMVTRRYADFEPLHQTLTTIARITGVPEFAQHYPALPSWRGQTSSALLQNLENFLRFCVKFEPLAETEAMKKFLDKETGLQKAPAQSKNVLVQGSAALENVGKNFINVLGQGGKNIAGGGKAVLGGVQGVFGAVTTGVGGAPKKPTASPRSMQQVSRLDADALGSKVRPSQDLSRQSTDSVDQAPPPLPVRPVADEAAETPLSSISPALGDVPRPSVEILSMPPPPSEIADDYQPTAKGSVASPPRASPDQVAIQVTTPLSPTRPDLPRTPSSTLVKPPAKKPKEQVPITDEETRILVELFFAILTELYSLSGAWSIRLSLLGAARTFLLRPNNPQLESIRALVQESTIDANFSDKGLAAHLTKLRENTLPTDEERAKWPKGLTAEEKEKLRVKARKLLVDRGMPQALTSVMGAAASGEALGRVFDCLQVEQVARGLIFALLLQAVRAMTQ